MQDEECNEAPLPPVHSRPDLQSCCSDVDAVNNVWMVAYSDCQKWDTTLPDIEAFQKSFLVIRMETSSDVKKCKHGCCFVHGETLTWSLATDTEMTATQFKQVLAWINDAGQKLQMLLCNDLDCGAGAVGAGAASGAPVNPALVDAFREQQRDLQVWAELTECFQVVLPRVATTELNLTARFFHSDGSVAFRSTPVQTRQEWESHGQGYAQKKRKSGIEQVPKEQYHAAWWIMAFFWEKLDAHYKDDEKVKVPEDGQPKHPLSLRNFTKKNAVRFGQASSGYLAGLSPEANRVIDVVQLTRDMATFFEKNSVGEENKEVFGYKGLHKHMLGDLKKFCAPVAQKAATFLPCASLLLGTQKDDAVARDTKFDNVDSNSSSAITCRASN